MLPLLLLVQPPPAVPFDTPPAADLAAVRAKAERLPPPPKLDPANVHVPGPPSPLGEWWRQLDLAALAGGLARHDLAPPDASRLLVEVGTVAGRKAVVRVLVSAEVCNRQCLLEMLLTNNPNKTHEAILLTSISPQRMHECLLAAGGVPGKPVQFVNPKTGAEEYRPASGSRVRVGLHYRRDGQLHTHPGQEWVRDVKGKKPLAHGWVFPGSRWLTNPDLPAAPPAYAAEGGTVVSIANFGDSMLELPVLVTADNAGLEYETVPERIPPLFSGVWVTLQLER